MAEINQKLIDEIKDNREQAQAVRIIRQIGQALQTGQVNSKEAEQYRKWRGELRLLAMPVLTTEEIKAMLSTDIIEYLANDDIYLLDGLKLFLINYFGRRELEERRSEFVEALERNRERLGDKEIMIEEKLAPSEVGTWLADYVVKMGRGRKKRSEISKYFTENNNFRGIDDTNKKKIRELIYLFNFLQPVPHLVTKLRQLDDADIWWGVDFPEEARGNIDAWMKPLEREGGTPQPQTGRIEGFERPVGDILARTRGKVEPVKPQAPRPAEGPKIDEVLRKRAQEIAKTQTVLPKKPIAPQAPKPQIPATPPASPVSGQRMAFKDAENLGKWEPATKPQVPVDKKKTDVREILEKYPKTGDQVITQAALELQDGTKAPATMRNWVRNYIEEKGLDYHTKEEREAYLLAGNNPARLSSEEKDKVRKVLESFDDGKTLEIDEKSEKLIF